MSLISRILSRTTTAQLRRGFHTIKSQDLASFCRHRLVESSAPPFRHLYPNASAGDCVLFEHASSILKDTDQLASFLVEIDRKLAEFAEHEDPLESVLAQMEHDTGKISRVDTLCEVMSADEFQTRVRNRVSFRDEGVSVFHGLQIHRIQALLLAANMSKDEFDELFCAMGSVVRVNEHRDSIPNEVFTPWDDLMDRLSRSYYSNRDCGIDIRNIVTETATGEIEMSLVPEEKFWPEHNAKNPEWLTRIIVCAPDNLIDNLREVIRRDFVTRLDEVHFDVFLAFDFGSHHFVDVADKQMLLEFVQGDGPSNQTSLCL